MRLKETLRGAVARLEAARVGSPRMNAEVLLMFVLGCDRAYLYAHPEHELRAEEEARYEEALAQRAQGVPAQYITGHQEFWGLDFIVSPAVLIPRPETEHLVEAALEVARGLPRVRMVDVGTGSGCVALALAHKLPEAEIHATDISAEALEIARANAARLEAGSRVRFHQGDLLDAVTETEFDCVVSNPPYIGESEADRLQLEVRKFEPEAALLAGPEGLDVIRRLIPQAWEKLRANGWLLMEIGQGQDGKVRALLQGWREVRFVADLQGIARVAVGRKS
jgi:release factor glutamine methyltransferase